MEGKLEMIYIDNSATTPIDTSVLNTYQKVATQFYGNPGSLHVPGVKSYQLLEKARKQVAEMIQKQEDEVIFTSGGTESNNLAIRGTVFAKREFGNHVITSTIEHPSVLNTIAQLESMGFITVTYLSVDQNGVVDPEEVSQALRPETILVSLMAVNNEIGSIQPILAVGDLLESHQNVHYHVDGVQSLGAFPSIIPHDRIDLMTFSAHKFHGPRGVGFLYKKHGRTIQPQLTGGGQESQLRSTTENVAGITAMARALRLHPDHGNAEPLRKLLKRGISACDNIVWLSLADGVPYINCLAIEHVKGEVLLHALEDEGIYVSTTSACSSKTHSGPQTLLAMGIEKKVAEGAIRLSFSDQTTSSEIEHVCEALKKHANHFKTVFQNH